MFRFALCLACLSAALVPLAVESPTAEDLRATSLQQLKDGNFSEASAGFTKLVMEALPGDQHTGDDLNNLYHCMVKLGRFSEVDGLLSRVTDRHNDNWRALQAAAGICDRAPHYGLLQDGVFLRGAQGRGFIPGNRGPRGTSVDSRDRDRVRSLQLLTRALSLAEKSASRVERASLYHDLGRRVRGRDNQIPAWKLQAKTDLTTLPDYKRASFSGRIEVPGAPVNDEGQPVLHAVPESWDAAISDGERWRWCMEQESLLDPNRKPAAMLRYAQFLSTEFGVHTMLRRSGAAEVQSGDGPWSVHTLGEDETIALLATGIRRFTFPDGHNPIQLLRSVAAGDGDVAGQAADSLVRIFQNRRQRKQAAAVLSDALKRLGEHKQRREMLSQLVGNWGRIPYTRPFPAGKGAVIDFQFRNATEVQFEAHPVDISKLIRDAQTQIKANARVRTDFHAIGRSLLDKEGHRYLGERIAAWKKTLKPPADHADGAVTVATPLQEPGVYLVIAKIPDGNTSRVIVWVTDAAIVARKLDQKYLYYVAKADNGTPVAAAQLQFFGYKRRSRGRNKSTTDVKNLVARTNANGIALMDEAQLKGYTWLVSTKTPGDGLAMLGFNQFWFAEGRPPLRNQTRVYTVTDRPVYRPGQTVHYKIWVRNPRYTGEPRDFANTEFTLRLSDGRGTNLVNKSVTLDEFGSVSGTFELADDAALGRYTVTLRSKKVGGGHSFRVEEYRKPEYEVTVSAPSVPIALGGTAKAKISARYYFGSPVTEARVKYKVTRTPIHTRWYPRGPWDWLYGRGYGWLSVNRGWYPGSSQWCCLPPPPLTFGGPPPEVVVEREVEIGADGTVEFEIDTAPALALHGHLDHRYRITAEVVDRSRRTIVGQGEVLVSREPFQVSAWTGRGHYKSGDRINVDLRAATLDGTVVVGKAAVRLLKITYDADAKPVETEVATATVELNQFGSARHEFRAAATGQYRIAAKVTDTENRSVDGGRLVMVLGGNENGADYRFNDLELIADKRVYQPGDTAELLINTNQIGSTVLLFVRPENGIYSVPRVVRLQGKSKVETLRVAAADMPNAFVEALTVSDGKVHTQLREILVPPAKRIARVEVDSAADAYQPGGKAELTLSLTDQNGKPVRTPTVVCVYDKSVEAIAGSTIPDIRKYFWHARRSHRVSLQTDLHRIFQNLLKPGDAVMQNFYMSHWGLQPMMFSSAAGRRGGGEGGWAQLHNVEASLESVAGARGASVQPAVRRKFADTAYWAAAVHPDVNGKARVSFDLPDDLTTWKVRTWVVAKDSTVGQGDAEFVTRKNLLVRMQTPRFFTERDEVVLSANVHNYLDNAKAVRVQLELDGDQLSVAESLSKTIDVPANGEVRVDWRATVNAPGTAVVRMLALTDEESDAVERSFPVYVHGTLKTETWTGSLTSDRTSFDVTVPKDRRPDATELTVRYSPTLAGAMVDALPYLVDGPHHTSDATLYRFVPSVVVQRILQQMEVNLDDVRAKRANLNAAQLGDPKDRAAQWKVYKRNPVFSNEEVSALVQENLNVVVDMQLSDGGWGWFSGRGSQSTPYMTAIMVHGLQIARQNDVGVPEDALSGGIAWLKRYQQQQIRRIENWVTKPKGHDRKQYADNMDAFVFMVLANADVRSEEMQGFLYRDRIQLALTAKAMFGLALHTLEQREQLAMLLRNLHQYVREDKENQTALLHEPDGGGWWHWYRSNIETQAWYLKLLSRTDPRNPRTAAVARYIVNNRGQARWWTSPRDTAIAVESLADFVKATGEFSPELEVEVLVDGKRRKQLQITSENLFTYDDRVTLGADQLSDGRHTVEIRRKGRGPLYYSAYLTNFTKEDAIAPAGLELRVKRSFYRLVPIERDDLVAGSRGQVVVQKGRKYRRERIVNFAEVRSGDLIDVELTVDSKNDYQYIVLEDPKPAGFEAVDQTSGYKADAVGAYVEIRDNRVMMYLRALGHGRHSLSYRVRAEVPGAFGALPTKAYAMYAPELKGNSNNARIVVVDTEAMAR